MGTINYQMNQQAMNAFGDSLTDLRHRRRQAKIDQMGIESHAADMRLRGTQQETTDISLEEKRRQTEIDKALIRIGQADATDGKNPLRAIYEFLQKHDPIRAQSMLNGAMDTALTRLRKAKEAGLSLEGEEGPNAFAEGGAGGGGEGLGWDLTNQIQQDFGVKLNAKEVSPGLHFIQQNDGTIVGLDPKDGRIKVRNEENKRPQSLADQIAAAAAGGNQAEVDRLSGIHRGLQRGDTNLNEPEMFVKDPEMFRRFMEVKSRIQARYPADKKESVAEYMTHLWKTDPEAFHAVFDRSAGRDSKQLEIDILKLAKSPLGGIDQDAVKDIRSLLNAAGPPLSRGGAGVEPVASHGGAGSPPSPGAGLMQQLPPASEHPGKKATNPYNRKEHYISDGRNWLLIP